MMRLIELVQRFATFKREPFFEIAKKYIDSNSSILDIGAGEASFAQYLGRQDVYMLEGSLESATKIAQTFPHVICADLPQLPYSESFFDMIHCSHVVEHLAPHDLYELLKEMDRCLKINGFIVISAPLLSPTFYDDLSHVKPYSPQVFKRYFTHKDKKNYTRTPISQSYEVVEEVYRFAEVPFDEYRFFIGSRIINVLYYKWRRFIYKIGFRQYVKNGFTLILQKK